MWLPKCSQQENKRLTRKEPWKKTRYPYISKVTWKFVLFLKLSNSNKFHWILFIIQICIRVICTFNCKWYTQKLKIFFICLVYLLGTVSWGSCMSKKVWKSSIANLRDILEEGTIHDKRKWIITKTIVFGIYGIPCEKRKHRHLWGFIETTSLNFIMKNCRVRLFVTTLLAELMCDEKVGRKYF